MSFKNYMNTYVFDTVLPGNGKEIKFKPITTGQLKRLLVYESVDDMGKIEEALDQLISECVVTEEFDVNELYLQDRFFLLLEIRKVTKGNNYQFQATCPKCNNQSLATVDLTKLPVKKFKLNIPKMTGAQKVHVKSVKKTTADVKEEEPFSDIIELRENIKIRLSMLTRGMQAQAFNHTKDLPDLTEMQKKIEAMSVLNALAIRSIITPEGTDESVPLEDKIFLINNITQAEQEKINEWFDKYDFGIDFTFMQKCPHCKAESRREIPLEDFFF